MLGWALNLGFAGSSSTAVATAVRMTKRWLLAVLYADGVPRPANRPNYASFGAGVITPATPVYDVLVVTEAGVATASVDRCPVNLTRFSPGAAVPPAYRLISE